jgi:A/G-specific adenine glycosylase
LLTWFADNARELPWRRDRDPYAIWLSEIMLQQTQVERVTPLYERFLARFPDIDALAKAPVEAVLEAWQGLGYYGRARRLHVAACEVRERYQGEFPATEREALALPGIGRYTAGAILSIAYGVPLPVVDGNVARVLGRLEALRGNLDDAGTRRALWALASELVPAREPGDWNQALMELGATVCTPKNPACPACPLRDRCRALALGRVGELPEGRARRTPVNVTVAAALVERDGRILLAKRPEGRLLGRMWEVPQTPLEPREGLDLPRELEERYGLRVVPGPLVVRARHAITHRRITLVGYRSRLESPVPSDPERFRWVTPAEVAALPVSSMTKKLLRGLDAPQLPLEV